MEHKNKAEIKINNISCRSLKKKTKCFDPKIKFIKTKNAVTSSFTIFFRLFMVCYKPFVASSSKLVSWIYHLMPHANQNQGYFQLLLTTSKKHCSLTLLFSQNIEIERSRKATAAHSKNAILETTSCSQGQYKLPAIDKELPARLLVVVDGRFIDYQSFVASGTVVLER